MSTLAVICKEPRAGFVKTRLCPPCTPAEAARIAEASLADTFDAVRATPCMRRVAVLDGEAGSWLGPGIDVVAQRGDGLDERLASAFEDLGGPTVIVGMDTPQVTPGLLAEALVMTARAGAAIGLSEDGGYWAIGLAAPDRDALEGVPMSTAWTGAAQIARLRERGLFPAALPALLDFDDIAAALRISRAVPDGRFAAAVGELDRSAAA